MCLMTASCKRRVAWSWSRALHIFAREVADCHRKHCGYFATHSGGFALYKLFCTLDVTFSWNPVYLDRIPLSHTANTSTPSEQQQTLAVKPAMLDKRLSKESTVARSFPSRESDITCTAPYVVNELSSDTTEERGLPSPDSDGCSVRPPPVLGLEVRFVYFCGSIRMV